MSTRAIRKVLEELRERLTDDLAGPPFSRDQTALDQRRLEDVDAAIVELEKIEEAAKAACESGATATMRAKGYGVSAMILLRINQSAP